MTPERWRRINELFEQEAGLDPAGRTARLEAASGGDPELRGEVERLLAADQQAGSFLENLVRWTAEDLSTGGDLPADRRIGPYRIEREIGQGGMGTVYLAERADGVFEKEVAVKVVRRGFDTADALRRFELEQRILARLEHPGIARLYDAGATEEGLPYVVMEHVEGLPIHRWCEEHRLAVAERLKLFLEVCAAVHYAHQNLVAHRDIKPSNILVDAAGRPRLLDFGIAKLLSPEGEDAADPTRAVQRPMTPGYASREQIRGEPVTTASDVYSLGVLLYELLAGRQPFVLAGLSPREIERIVSEETAQPPSRAAVSPELLAGRPEGAERLRRLLAGDLDRIVLKAMHKEPGRRYATVDQLADDIRRHLTGLPVLARGDSFWYRTGKLVRRHKLAAALVLVVVAAGLGTAVLAVERARALDRATASLVRADREAAKAREATDLLVELFKVSDRRETAGETVTAQEVLSQGTRRVEAEVAKQPEVAGELLGTIGRVYINLGLPREAVPVLRRAFTTARRAHGPRHPDVAKALDDLAEALREDGQYAAAEPLVRHALALRRDLLGEEHPDVAASLGNLGVLLFRSGNYPAAEAALTEALALRRRLDERVPLGDSLTDLASLYLAKAEYDRAELLFREAVEVYRRQLGPEHPITATGLNNLGITLYRKGDFAAAEPLLREALRLQRRDLGDDDPAVAGSLENLAGMLAERGDVTAAEPLAREALALQRKLGDRNPIVARCTNSLAVLLHYRGDLAAAERLFREALVLRREILPPEHPDIAASLLGLGAVLADRGEEKAAESLLREALAIRRRVLQPGHWRIATVESELGGCLARQHRWQEARPLLVDSYPRILEALGAKHQLTRRAFGNLARLDSVGLNHPTSRSLSGRPTGPPRRSD